MTQDPIPAPSAAPDRGADRGSAREVFAVFLRLGLTAFGGPVAHLGYFRDEIVARRRWLSDAAYADLVALCQVLPGPASSQVGMGLGLTRAGWPGLLAAALVTLWPLTPLPLPWGQVAALVLGGLVGAALPSRASWSEAPRLAVPVGKVTGLSLLALFALLLAGLPLAAAATESLPLALADSIYRAGALVFGGGHVVLPLLQAEVVGPGWVDADAFLAGYGVVQAMPGPLFSFASYLGAATGLGGGAAPAAGLAALATVMVFLPGGLLLCGALPFWDALRRRPAAREVLAGINAAVVGLLLAALYDPVFTAAVHGPKDVALVLLAALLLMTWKAPPWLAVLATGAAGALATMI